MNNKGQSALEFLTTYGWAFLIILIMIGALAYFGVLNPRQFLPERCTFPIEFQCEDHAISENPDTLRLKLRNSVGESLTVQSILFTNENGVNLPCTEFYPAAFPWAETWRSGNVTDFFWDGGCNFLANGITSGDKGKILVTIRYYSVASGSDYIKEAKGEVISNVN